MSHAPAASAPGADPLERVLAALTRIEARLDRLEAAQGAAALPAAELEARLAALEQRSPLPGSADLLADAGQTLARHVGAAAAQGVDLRERAAVGLRLAERSTDPAVAEGLLRVIEAGGAHADEVVAGLRLLGQLPGLWDDAARTAGSHLRSAADNGVDLADRLRVISVMGGTVSDPAVAEGLLPLIEAAAAYGPDAAQGLRVLSQLGGLWGDGAAAASGLWRAAQQGPTPPAERAKVALVLAERLTDPAVAEGLLALTEPACLDALGALAARGPALVAGLDALEAQLGPDGLGGRLAAAGPALERLSRPAAIDGLAHLMEHHDVIVAVAQALGAAFGTPEARAVAARGSAALVGAQGAPPLGLVGAWRASGEAEVQRSLGFLIALARGFGGGASA
jgi:hypothetical protein